MTLDPLPHASNIVAMDRFRPFTLFTGFIRLQMLLLCLTLSGAVAANEPVQASEIQNLIQRLTEARSDYAQLSATGQLSGADQADYLSWITQLEDQLRQSCRAQAGPKIQPAEQTLCTQLITESIAPAAIDLSGELTQSEKNANIMSQLSGSLSEFDEKLLQEQQRIKAQKPRDDSATDAASGGGANGGNDSAQGSQGNNGEQQGTDKQGKRNTGQPAGTEGTDTPPAGKQGSGTNSTPGKGQATPDDIPDGRDDDVVARQLREAAEKETDPELKKKLWEEYRRYKAGTTR